MDRAKAIGKRQRIVLAAGAVISALVLVAWLSAGGGSQETATEPTDGPVATPGEPTSADPSVGPTPSNSAGSTPQSDASPAPSVTLTPVPSNDGTPTALVTVPVEPLESRSPIELTETADFGTGLTVEVAELRAVTGEARVPGEVGGPALWVKVRARNGTDEAISLATADVQVTYGPNRVPGIALGGPDVSPFPASLAPGRAATASYVYNIPISERDQVQVVVFYSTDAPLVVFEGAAP